MLITKNTESLSTSFVDPIKEPEVKYPFTLNILRFFFKTVGRIFPRKAAQTAFNIFATPRKRAKHRKAELVLESAKIFDVLYGNIILKGYEWGKADDPIVLLVHGWESRGTGLRTFVPKLVAAGFRVITFDGPAHGDSEGKRTNLPHFAGAIRAVINQVGTIDTIIAHSFGGVTTTFALAHLMPETAIRKLVFIAVPSSTKLVMNHYLDLMHLPPNVRKEFFDIVEKDYLKMPLLGVDVAINYARVQSDATLIIHDKKDKIVSVKESLKILDQWDNAHLVTTQGYGHYRIMKNPDVVNRIIQFIVD